MVGRIMKYTQTLKARMDAINSRLCVGLDPRADVCDPSLEFFMMRILEETAPYAAAFKPNLAYYEAFGSAGLALMERILARIPDEIPVILDAKRSDIGTTAERYAHALFDTWGADAVTLNPLMGFDSVAPFLRYEGRAAYLLGVTSNPGADDFLLKPVEGRIPAAHLGDWRERATELPGELGLVAGLTNLTPDVLAQLPDWPLLCPGFGAQGGSADALTQRTWRHPVLINVSRGILYGGPDLTPGERADQYRQEINRAFGKG